MRRFAAIGVALSVLPTVGSTETAEETLINCAAIIDARYSDPVFSQEEYVSIPLTVSLMLEIAAQRDQSATAEDVQQSFDTRAAAYRERMGKVTPEDAESGNLPDWAISETVRCQGVMLNHKDEFQTLLAQRLEKQ